MFSERNSNLQCPATAKVLVFSIRMGTPAERDILTYLYVVVVALIDILRSVIKDLESYKNPHRR